MLEFLTQWWWALLLTLAALLTLKQLVRPRCPECSHRMKVRVIWAKGDWVVPDRRVRGRTCPSCGYHDSKVLREG